jgi:peptidoglycan/xylan/chitin deacetylase (PgdA/CDA1 family)
VVSEINIEYQTSRGSKSYAWVATLPSTGGAWQQAKISFTVPAGVAKASVFHLLDKQGVLTIDEIALVKDGGSPPPPPSGGFSEGMVTLSFDDAWTSQYVAVLPILENAGLKGTFYVLTQPVQNGWSTYMTPSQVVDIANKGHEIQGHTVSHRDLTTLSQATIDNEIKNSKAYLQTLTGKTITSLAYPYGSSNAKVVDSAKVAGYTSGRTADPTIPYGFNTQSVSRFSINSFSPTKTTTLADVKAAIDRAKAEKLWFVFSIHQVRVNGDQYDISPALFADIVSYVKSSGIKVVTMTEGAALLAN